jgi:2-haloacid dehalogenase
MAQPPRTVIFDLGKVLVDFDYAISARKLAGENAKSRRRKCKTSSTILPCSSGMRRARSINRSFDREVCKLTGYCGAQNEFEPVFSDIFSPIEPMIELQADLRRRNIPTYILSNTNDLAVGHIRRAFPFFSNFDGYVFSYEQRVMKPHAQIYEIAEKLTGYRGAEIVYIDDRLENIGPGVQRGWNVIHHQSPESTIETLRKLGLVEDW